MRQCRNPFNTTALRNTVEVCVAGICLRWFSQFPRTHAWCSLSFTPQQRFPPGSQRCGGKGFGGNAQKAAFRVESELAAGPTYLCGTGTSTVNPAIGSMYAIYGYIW